MSHLYHHLRLHQIFGANTDVGKTLFTTALCIASTSLPLPSNFGTSQEEHERDVRDAMQRLAVGRSSPSGEKVHYLKPVSTGPMEDSDDSHVSRYASPSSEQTLLRFPHPVSPHLASRLSAPSVSPLSDLTITPTDTQLLRSIGDWISNSAALSPSEPSVAYIETAGGPHSPSPSGTSQVTLLRPLRLPTILIGDSKLGGISTTRSAYESLIIAGHQVDALLLFTEGKDDKWGNAEYLTKWGQEVGLPVWPLAGLSESGRRWGGPPARAHTPQEEQMQMQDFYRGLVYGRRRWEGDEEQVEGVVDVVRHLRQAHHLRIAELETVAGRTRQSCWWPFTQHGLAKADTDVTVIDSAHGDFFSSFRQRERGDDGSDMTGDNDLSAAASTSKLYPLLDGSASWWTQCLGHSHPALAQAAARAAGRYGHVLFPMAANAPALRLAEGLLGRRERTLYASSSTASYQKGVQDSPAPGKGWADRVFFSDNGATGMEVALKMAIASTRQRYAPPSLTAASEERVARGRKAGSMGGRREREWKIIGLKGSYHGDTIGVMDACEPSVYSKKVDWYRSRGCWLDTPSIGVEDGQTVLTIPASVSEDGHAAMRITFSSLQEAYDVASRLRSDKVAALYKSKIRKWLDERIRLEGERFGALVIEPIILGAGGMVFVDPLFQRCLVDVVRESEDLFTLTDPPLRDSRAPRMEKDRAEGEWRGLPVIYDEVFTGLYRLGHATPTSLIGANPDISVLAKILTGGVVPMSVTLASQSIFETFSKGTESKVDALLHGHSYTAHPVGCEVANETMKILTKMHREGEWDVERRDWGCLVAPTTTSSSSSPPSSDTSSSTAVSREEETDIADIAAAATAVAPSSSTPAIGIWSFWSQGAVQALSRSGRVQSVMAMGTVLVLQLRDDSNAGYSSTAATSLLQRLRLSPFAHQRTGGHASMSWKESSTGARTVEVDVTVDGNPFANANATPLDDPLAPSFEIHARPLGNIVYFMCSLNTPKEIREGVEHTLKRELL